MRGHEETEPDPQRSEEAQAKGKIAANLNHGAESFDEHVERRINDVMTLMNLQKCKNRKIPKYPPTSGAMGGDLRRLSIAVQIVALPKVRGGVFEGAAKSLCNHA
jgi:ABC-type dipeptide/oligopeptide/nickel transport system ATPase component